MRHITFNRFQMVYWMIALATAQHTAWGAATTMQGALPENAMNQFGWWLQGIAFAIAIDVSMVMVASKIRGGVQSAHAIRVLRWSIPINWYTVTFTAVSAFSFYFQLVYAWSHSQALPNVGGVASNWVERLQPLIDARIVIAPMALPFIATLYTIGGLGKGGEAQAKRTAATQPAQPPRNVAQPATVVTRIESPELPALPRSEVAQLPAPQPQKLRDEAGHLVAYICPGCGKQLSVSGWSRHRKQCEKLSVNQEVE